MLVTSGFSRFAEDSFGYTMQSSECISLLRCTRDIKPHLWGLHVADASLRGEIQLSWARVDTETNFMLMHRSIRNFNFPTPWKLNSWKLVLHILTPGTKIMFKCPTLVHFVFWKRKTRATHGYFTIVRAWGMENLRGWVEDFESGNVKSFKRVKEIKVHRF